MSLTMMVLHSPLVWLCDTSLRVSVAIVLLMLVRPWLRKFGGSRALPWLWLIVAVRLLLPWPVASRWSFVPARWGRHLEASLSSKDRMPVAQQFQGLSVSAESAHSALLTQAPVSVRPLPVLTPATGVHSLDAWNILWLLGAASCLANLVHHWRQTSRWSVAVWPGLEDAAVSAAFAGLPEKYRRGVAWRITTAVDVPAVSGVFRPQIWVPHKWVNKLTEQEWQHVLLHELGHVRRHDLLAQWVCSLACCVHWFNPLVWMAAKLARVDRELACDAWVLARGTRDGNADFSGQYGSTLLKIVAQWRTPALRGGSPATLPMANSKRHLSLRVREIGAFDGAPAWRGFAAAIVLASVMLISTFNSAATGQGTSGPTSNPVTSPSPAAEAALPTPSSNPSAAATSTAREIAAPPASTPGPTIEHPISKKWIEVDAKILALRKSSVAELEKQQTQDPASVELVSQLASVFGQADRSTEATPGTFSVSQVLAADANQKFLQEVVELKGVDVLGAPRVTTISGQTATIEIIREFLYPTQFARTILASVQPAVTPKTVLTPTKFDKKNIGLTLRVSGDIASEGDNIDFNVRWESAELQGWVNEKGKPVAADQAGGTSSRPVFATQTIETCVTMPSGATLLLASPPRAPGTWHVAGAELGASRDNTIVFNEDYVVLNFITVTVLHRPPAAAAAMNSEPMESSSEATERERTEQKKAELTAALNRKAQSLIIPKVEFHATTLSDAIEFLRAEYQRLDPEPDPSLRGVNIFLKLPGRGATKQLAANPLAPVAAAPPGTAAIPAGSDGASPATPPSPTSKVTLTMERVTLLSALHHVATQVGLKVKVEPYAVCLVPLTEETETMVTKDFRVAAEGLGGPPAPPVDAANPPAAPLRLNAKTWLEAKGITFPVGSSATYLVPPGKLVMRNTQENMDRVTILVAASGAKPVPNPRRRADGLPYATPVPGRPGYVISPYAPDAGYIDVQGLEPDEEARDPYTGKQFVIP